MSSDFTPAPTNGGIAVGAYLRVLRESSGWTVAEIAEKARVDASQIWRVENWKSDTRSSLLFRLLYVLRGDANDVALLINNPKATAEDGENLARLRIQIR